MARRLPPTSWIRVVLAGLLVAGCGAAGAPPEPEGAGSSGRSRDAVCERYMQVLSESGGITSFASDAARTSPPEAVQHRRSARALRTFGRWASTATDDSLAANASAIQREAADVLATLEPTDSAARSSQVTAPLYEQTAKLFYDCNAETYRAALRGDRPLDGACAEPGAPTLTGPNVIVYGSLDNFVESECVLEAGVAVEGGCQQAAGSAGPDEQQRKGPQQAVEVAYDPDTCQSLFEVGRVRPGG